MNARKLGLTARYVLMFGVLLVLANVTLGIVVLNQSKAAMRSLIDKDMLDIANAAAGTLDGDALGSLTEEDVDGPVFQEIKRQLLVFQNSVDIQFIYAVKETDDGLYVFTVDPDPVDPGAFGEEIVVTPALVSAAKGVAFVDSDPAADRWGNFYSAYSPVFDSSGNVAGVVGLDFDTEWYEQQVTNNSLSIALVTALSGVTVCSIMMLITNRVRVKFGELDEALLGLSEDVNILMSEMSSYSGMDMFDSQVSVDLDTNASDELEAIGNQIRTLREETSLYLEYLRTQAYIDPLTKVGSSAAYHEAVDELNQKIDQGVADFWVVVVDINRLKELNDTLGHECGDYYIQGAAQSLVQGFGASRVYRIGGDEFAVVVEGDDRARVDECIGNVAAAVDAFNASSQYSATLSVSVGSARFEDGRDHAFKDVFSRADQAMYRRKKEAHAARP